MQPFAGGAISGAHQRIDRLIHIGIGHHDHVVLGATKRLATLPGVRGGRIDILRHER
ncbi:hypothetical protein ACVWW6_009025 [Bradyrhizobium sp. USDA 3311]